MTASRHGDRRDDPGHDDEPAEFDGERADSPEDGVDAHPVSILGAPCDRAKRPRRGMWLLTRVTTAAGP